MAETTTDVVLTVDIGGTKMAAGLMKMTGEMIAVSYTHLTLPTILRV